MKFQMPLHISVLKLAAKTLLSALALGMVGCNSNHAGVPSSVETENGITARFITPNGHPAARITVELQLPYSDPVAEPVQEGQTDQQGVVRFSGLPAGSYTLLGRGGDGTFGLARLQARSQQDSVVPSTRLQVPHHLRWHLNLAEGEINPGQLTVLGTSFALSIPIGQNTAMAPLRGELPAHENFWVRLTWADGRYWETSLRTGSPGDSTDISWTPLPSLSPRLPLADFENSCQEGLLSPLYGGSWWYVDAVNAVLDPPFLGANTTPNCVQSTPERGQVGALGWALTDSGTTFALMGLTLSWNNRVDLSALDSLIIWARGSGTVQISWITQDLLQAGLSNYFSYPQLELEINWTRYSLPSAALYLDSAHVPPSFYTSQWVNSARQTAFFQIISTTSGNIEIDDLELVGVGVRDLASGRPRY